MLLFLDIDGVMVPAKSWSSPELLNDGFPAFSDRAVRVLKQFISPDTTVMLTTSHKSRFTLEEWKAIFVRRGIDISSIQSLEECAFGVSRKDEILNWFNVNDVQEDFVILDDDKSLNDLPVFLKNRLIQTSAMIGLTDSHVEEFKSISERKVQLA